MFSTAELKIHMIDNFHCKLCLCVIVWASWQCGTKRCILLWLRAAVWHPCATEWNLPVLSQLPSSDSESGKANHQDTVQRLPWGFEPAAKGLSTTRKVSCCCRCRSSWKTEPFQADKYHWRAVFWWPGLQFVQAMQCINAPSVHTKHTE